MSWHGRLGLGNEEPSQPSPTSYKLQSTPANHMHALARQIVRPKDLVFIALRFVHRLSCTS
jgi:hypothetical protein